MISIKTSDFVAGAVSQEQFPVDNLPEIAFAGRSNVGKSSAINCLLNRKGLARASATPGKTREINFYLVNNAFRLVDLPGFGYAKVSHESQARWQSYIDDYLLAKRRLKGVVQMIDVRHPDQDNDLRMAEFLREAGLRACVVANKCDKLNRGELAKCLREVERIWGMAPIAFSAEKRLGRDDLWRVMQSWLED